HTSGFAEDTMRVLPNLSLTTGLRYDWQNTLDYRKDLAPRLALAFAPGERKRTVLRAGAGIFYDNLPRTATQQASLLDGVHVREIESTAFRQGHAATLTFRGGWGKHFKGYAQYVFSKYTNNTGGVFALPANNYDLRPETGPADFDRRHRVNFAGVMQFPFGFRIGSLLWAATGTPFDII